MHTHTHMIPSAFLFPFSFLFQPFPPQTKVPIKALVDFQRISLKPKEETKVVFALEESAFRLVNVDGARVIYKGARSLIVSRGVGLDVVLSVTI